ncbi:methyl-accepting chemotaxis protein [Geomesophilobacter sediminis]|uniref:GAF domain-containing protein n=1 Tax=Geomesophilobacter sediminis TaxID=2798584 RepID=A0A8J7JKU9_9BACT|nr:methyl-accepting chemotaxis protein [Geomesophilobacter sediminis]MBJ6724205.1 GAF domain-containing protein [Geomesophilobacter sediminis]
MRDRLAEFNRSNLYGLIGFFLGISAPIGWTVLRLIFFSNPELSLGAQIFGEVTENAQGLALYTYMGAGTACVLASFGYFIGKAMDELHFKGAELDKLVLEVDSQKQLFENRYKVLDNNIKNFHKIGSRIQKSMRQEDVLSLCVEGLHEVLGYERVNVLMADPERKVLTFAASAGNETQIGPDLFVPLDPRAGVIYKCYDERQVYFIEDISKYPADFMLQPPFANIEPLRSNCFILCPIVVKGETVGVFGLDNKRSHRSLNDTDVDTIRLFADQAAAALTRINLLHSIDQLTLELGKTFAELLKNRDSSVRNLSRLKSATDSLVEGALRIDGASHRVMESVDGASSSTAEISMATEQITSNLDALSDSVYKSVSAMEQITSSLRQVERNTALSHGISSKVKEQSEKSSQVVRETIDALAEIQRSVDLSYDGIKRLSANSGRIEGIVSVINDITKRTNLLALNASIIAAQAGEYGKSFGVVADEIRNLSLQTGLSTGEITSIINDIMTESRTAADNITTTKDLVKKGVELGHQTGNSLSTILESAQSAMDMTQQIKLATGEQSNAVQSVSQSIEDVSNMTSQIFKASKEQALATKSIARAMEEVKEMTHGMVASAGRQAADGEQIRTAVEAVTGVANAIFEDMEKRQVESGEVVKALELMRASAE